VTRTGQSLDWRGFWRFGSRIQDYDQDDHLIAETRSDGTPLRTYVWLAERPLTVIEHAALANPPRSLHLQHDHLGTPRLARNDAGVIQWRWDSDGYGTTTPTHDPDGDGKATVINLRFPGQYYDQESGNYHNWNRYCSPRLGRYLSADPIGIEGGPNGYGYVGGDPVGKTDPSGLVPIAGNWCGPNWTGGREETFNSAASPGYYDQRRGKQIMLVSGTICVIRNVASNEAVLRMMLRLPVSENVTDNWRRKFHFLSEIELPSGSSP